MKKVIKILSIILSAMIVVTALPLVSFADMGDFGGDTSDNSAPSVTPEVALTVSDVINSINEATERASVSSYKWSRNGYYTEEFDIDSKDMLNSLITSIDANASVDSVFGSFLGVGEKQAGVNYGELPAEGMNSADYLLKGTNLKADDVSQFRVNGNVYMLLLEDCTNPQKDEMNSLHHATNDFITIDGINESVGEINGTLAFKDTSTLDYDDILVTATIEDGYLTELEISYLIKATLVLNLMDTMTTTGVGTVKTDIKYYDIVYDGVSYIPFGDVNGDGFVNDDDTGLFEYGDNLYYIENGAFNFEFAGLCKYNGVWYYINTGLVDFGYTGLVKHTNGIWYYVENGVLDWSHSGLWKHNGTWYYVQKGQINWKFAGLVKHTNDIWYYVQGAKLSWGYTGLVKHNTGSWFYVQKGQINFDYTGLVKHTNGIWYYVQNGKLNWNKTGLVKHTDGNWYYVQKGQINWSYTGLVKHTNGKWYYVQKGKLNWKYTGYTYYNGVKYKVVNGEKA